MIAVIKGVDPGLRGPSGLVRGIRGPLGYKYGTENQVSAHKGRMRVLAESEIQ